MAKVLSHYLGYYLEQLSLTIKSNNTKSNVNLWYNLKLWKSIVQLPH